MIHAQNEKVVASVSPAKVDVDATATLTIDTLGYDHASIKVLRGGVATTVFASVLKVEEGDTTSSYSNVTALVGGGSGGFTIPAASSDTDSTSIVKMDVDCRARKRYLKVSCSPGGTANVSIVASLSRAEVSPENATKAGVGALVKA